MDEATTCQAIIDAAVAEIPGIVTNALFVAEVIGEDGSIGLWIASTGMPHWTRNGLLQAAMDYGVDDDED